VAETDGALSVSPVRTAARSPPYAPMNSVAPPAPAAVPAIVVSWPSLLADTAALTRP